MTTRGVRKVLWLADMPLRLALALLALTLAGHALEQAPSSLVILFIAGTSAALYVAIRLQSGFGELVIENNDAKLLLNNTKSEVKYALGAIALVYLFRPEITYRAFLTFLGFNFILQTIPALVTQYIRVASRTSSPQDPRTALIYGAGENGKLVADALVSNPQSNITPIGFVDDERSGLWRYRDIPLICGTDDLREIVGERQVDALILAPEPHQLAQSQRIFGLAEEMGVTVCVLPHIYQTKVSACRMKSFNGQPTLIYSSDPTDGLSDVAKRVVDIVGALVGIALTAPILLITTLAVKITSPGPALFRQMRVGKNGAPFKALKFRSMCADAEKLKFTLAAQNEMSGPVFKIRKDPRVTPVGSLLRKYSIDELPQLFNVLAGDMSLVGPRPALPKEVAQFAPWQKRKLAMKPGCTCVWQVSGRNAVDFDSWMKMDLKYIDTWSLWQDAKILARTIPTVIRGAGC